MKSPEALVEPELLKWARRSIHYTVEAAAKKMGITPERLTAWEAGDERPTIVQLRKAAATYKRPLAVFFLPAPPKDFEVMRDFRRITPAHPAELSPELAYNIRRAWERREAALELYEEIDTTPIQVDLKVSLNEQSDDVGSRVRVWLDIEEEEQLSWQNDYAAFSAWEAALERRGALVFQTRNVTSEEARGFSIGADILPVIVVNGKDTPAGRAFTLFHELTHILLRDSVLCDLGEEGLMRAGSTDVEVFCNRTAAAILIPAASLERQPGVSAHGPTSAWLDSDLARLARRFSVSKEAMLRRLVDIGRASPEFYKRKRAEYERQYKNIDHERDQDGAHIPQHVLALKYNGVHFSRIVLMAYHQGAITSRDVYHYLGLKPKNIENLELSLLRKSA